MRDGGHVSHRGDAPFKNPSPLCSISLHKDDPAEVEGASGRPGGLITNGAAVNSP